MKSSRSSGTGTGAFIASLGGCLSIILIIILINVTIGGLAFQYVLEFTTGKDIPWYADCIAGLFLGEAAIPLAVICWIMSLCGVMLK